MASSRSQPQALRLAVQELLVYCLVDQRMQLRLCRLPAPLREPAGAEPVDLIRRDLDHGARRFAAGQPAVEREHADAQEHEGDEGIAQPARHPVGRHATRIRSGPGTIGRDV